MGLLPGIWTKFHYVLGTLTLLCGGVLCVTESPDADCRRGYKRSSSLTGCEACPKGTYQPEPSQFDCLDCPDQKTTLLPGRISVNTCVEACGDGVAWNVVNETCDPCPLGYYRKASQSEACIKCPDGYTTVTIGSSGCPTLIDTTGQQTPSPPQTQRLVVRLVIRITYCTNRQQMASAISNFVRNILLATDSRFAALCEGTCINLRVRFHGGCLGSSRRRRQASQPDNVDQEVELELLNVPEEISGISPDTNQTVTQRTTDVVTRAFYDHQQEQDLLDANMLQFVEVASAEAIVQCQSGQKTVGGTCMNCGVGTYSTAGDVTVCESCPLGQYQDLTGQSSCKPCEEKTYTVSTGTNSSTLCIRRCDEPDSASKYCSGQGTCVYDPYTASGVRCDCNEQYTASNCSVRTPPSVDGNSSAETAAIAGSTAAGVVLLTVIVILSVIFYKRRTLSQSKPDRKFGQPHQEQNRDAAMQMKQVRAPRRSSLDEENDHYDYIPAAHPSPSPAFRETRSVEGSTRGSQSHDNLALDRAQSEDYMVPTVPHPEDYLTPVKEPYERLVPKVQRGENSRHTYYVIGQNPRFRDDVSVLSSPSGESYTNARSAPSIVFSNDNVGPV